MHENEIISYRWRKKIEESIEEEEEIAGKREKKQEIIMILAELPEKNRKGGGF